MNTIDTLDNLYDINSHVEKVYNTYKDIKRRKREISNDDIYDIYRR